MTPAFCGGFARLSPFPKGLPTSCNSRFSRPNGSRGIGAWHSRVLVACMSPPVHTSDSSKIPESPVENQVEESDEIYIPPGTKLVSLPLPLGVFTEQTVDGQVFVDEVDDEGNAAKPGGLQVGDVIEAVSLPYGNSLFPVPKTNGMDMIADYISSRDPSESLFHIAVSKGHDINDLRGRVEVDESWLTADEAAKMAEKIHITDYPIVIPETKSEEEDLASRANELEKYGFDEESIKTIVENKYKKDQE
ncbi:PDZ domain containing protein [Gracilaria domingensis]|nr:PDZ domain containing protein [Gracilaria domingensis]